MLGKWMLCAGVFLAAAVSGAAPAPGGDYAEDLARVYGAHQRLLATRDACDEVFPTRSFETDRAYAEWRQRHRALVEDLEARVTAMIHGVSRDPKDYSRNLGKYEGEIFQRRLDFKQTLLALNQSELDQQCRQFPVYLKGPDADFRRKYAEELKTIDRRK